jgi:phospholipase C
VEIQTTKLNPQSGTIAMWVYIDKQTLSIHYLFGHATSTFTNRIQLYLKYGNLCLGLGDSHETRTNIQQLQNQRWYHIALTWSNSTYNVYVDGSLKASGTYSGLTGLSDHADVGNNGVTRDKALNGRIDDVVIYNRMLDVNEIAQLAVN